MPPSAAAPQYWIDLFNLPESPYTHTIPSIHGSASYETKLAVLNAFYAYGVGEPGSFAESIGSRCIFTEIERDRSVLEVEVTSGII